MDTINFARLGAIIANARRARMMQGEQLARAVGIHPVTLSRIEHGKLPGLTVAVLMRLALALDISMNDLTGWSPQQWLREAMAQAEARGESWTARDAPSTP